MNSDTRPKRAPAPPEPLFRGTGAFSRGRELFGDAREFALIQVYYLLCLVVGAPAWLIDRLFGTALLDRFISAVERFDQEEP